MKKGLSKVVLGVTTLTLALGSISYATPAAFANVQPEMDYAAIESDESTAESNVVAANFDFDIAEEYSAYNSGNITFINEDTSQTFTQTVGNLYGKKTLTVFMPKGRYKFYNLRLNQSGNMVPQNYASKMEPEVVTVGDAGLETPAKISLYEEITTPQAQANKTLINDGDFDGYIGLSYYTISDAVSGKNKDHYTTMVTHTSAKDGEVINELLAGRSRISNVYAYDRDKKPLNVYVSPYYFYTTRQNDPQKLGNEPQRVFAFHNEDELTSEQKQYIKDNDYLLISAASMDEYTLFPNNKVVILANGERALDDVEVYINDIPSPEAGWQNYTKLPSGKDGVLRYGYEWDTEVTELETPKNYDYLIFIGLGTIAVIGGFLYFKIRKKNKEDEEENEKEENKEEKKKREKTS